MAGTGIVTVPWAFQGSGILLGSALTFIAFTISYITCYLVVLTAGQDIDYTVTLTRHFGRKGWVVGMVCFILNLYVPILIFFQLLAQNLYPIILAIVEPFTHNVKDPTATKPDWSEFSYTWTCVIIFALNFMITAYRNIQIFVKINSFGVIFIMIILVSIIGIGIYGLATTQYTYSKEVFQEYESDPNPEKSYLAFVDLAGKAYAPLMGILGGGYYFHNISLPVIRNAKDPSKNSRDVFIGYLCVCITYIACGCLGYYGFIGE